MNTRIIDIANRFLSEKDCTAQELTAFKKWLSNPDKQAEVDVWLAEHWASSPEIDSVALIDNVFLQIQEYQKTSAPKSVFSLTRILTVYRKIAAFLLVPLVALGLLYFVIGYNQSAGQYAETIAPRGQKSQIVLADGTKVWLNSDTKIKYPGNFSKKQRDVYLDGEAFFEVSKNAHHPFVVHTAGMDIKVLGTKFNVKSYADENHIETALFEGKIKLLMNNSVSGQKTERDVKPGQSFIYSKTNNKLMKGKFLPDEINGWKNNQLIFKDDTFNNLVKKLERWYDVKVVYDENQFNDRRLTVELREGERLERLMEIISWA